MSKDAEKISIYVKILQYIIGLNEKKQYPKTSDIINFLNKFDYSVSERTVNRYINAIGVDFDVDISKTSHRGGYFVDTESSIYFYDIYKTLQVVDKSLYFKNMLQNSSEVIQYFSFYANEFRGFDWIDVILKAILNKDVIEITHQRFDTDIESIREVEPYLLKEYIDRWYIVGFDKKHKEFRSFGLDRIKKINILDKKFKKHRTKEVKEQFENTIGMIYSKPQIVVLSFNKREKEYFKASPWHHNYKIIKETENELIVELFVSINYELEQKILRYHTDVKVLEPQYLIDKIVDYSEKVLKQYKK